MRCAYVLWTVQLDLVTEWGIWSRTSWSKNWSPVNWLTKLWWGRTTAATAAVAMEAAVAQKMVGEEGEAGRPLLQKSLRDPGRILLPNPGRTVVLLSLGFKPCTDTPQLTAAVTVDPPTASTCTAVLNVASAPPWVANSACPVVTMHVIRWCVQPLNGHASAACRKLPVPCPSPARHWPMEPATPWKGPAVTSGHSPLLAWAPPWDPLSSVPGVACSFPRMGMESGRVVHTKQSPCSDVICVFCSVVLLLGIACMSLGWRRAIHLECY